MSYDQQQYIDVAVETNKQAKRCTENNMIPAKPSFIAIDMVVAPFNRVGRGPTRAFDSGNQAQQNAIPSCKGVPE